MVHITNITEIRRQASKVITRVIKEREPAVVLRRSKPVAYILEASIYEEMQRDLEALAMKKESERTRTGLEAIETVRRKLALRKRQPDSVTLIREIREGARHE